MTLKELYDLTVNMLSAAEVEDSRFDTDCLFEDILRRTRPLLFCAETPKSPNLTRTGFLKPRKNAAEARLYSISSANGNFSEDPFMWAWEF